MSLERRKTLSRFIQKGHEHAAKGDYWSIMFDGDSSYQSTFQLVLDSQPLKKVVDKWSDKDQVAGLDIMGYGAVCESLGLSHGLGIALTDARTADMKQSQMGRIDVAAGNIVQQRTWNTVEEWIQQRGLQDPHFRMIFFRPIAGVNFVPTDPETLFTLFHRAWKLLSKNNGEFFGVVPIAVENLVVQWVQELNHLPGVTARMQTRDAIFEMNGGLLLNGVRSMMPAIRITKGAEAPEALPMVSFISRRGIVSPIEYEPKPVQQSAENPLTKS